MAMLMAEWSAVRFSVVLILLNPSATLLSKHALKLAVCCSHEGGPVKSWCENQHPRLRITCLTQADLVFNHGCLAQF